MGMYDNIEYARLLSKLSLSNHAITRFYSRASPENTIEIGELRKIVARKLLPKLKRGCEAESGEVKLQVTENLRAIIVPDNGGWIVKSFVPESQQEVINNA